MNTFFTADTHFGHSKILLQEYEDRPFEDVEEMNETLIRNWNSVVSRKDHVWVLGDFSWGRPEKYAQRLNGKKFLVRGNHDRDSEARFKRAGFSEIWTYKELKIAKRKIVLSHYPFESWNGSFHGSLHFHGHVHSKGKFAKNRLNVGVDVCEMFQIEYEECLQAIEEINQMFP